MSQVSWEITSPKDARPTDGILFVNVEISPMAAPYFEAGKQSELGVEVNRLLERCLRESRCLDMESLCISAGIKVFAIRVDLHVLNYDGNITDALSIAAIASMCHFRRPDVTVCGEDVTIHSMEDRDPIPLNIHHMPMCVSFAFYDNGNYMLVDPSEKEEVVASGKMVIGMNRHREICLMQMSGGMLLQKEQILRCSNVCAVKVAQMSELVQRALENDKTARAKGEKSSFVTSSGILTPGSMKFASPAPISIKEKREEDVNMETGEDDMEEKVCPKKTVNVSSVGHGIASIGESGKGGWDVESDLDDDIEILQSCGKETTKLTSDSHKRHDVTISDSEEDDVTVVGSNVFGFEATAEKLSQSTVIDLTAAVKPKNKSNKKKKHAKK